jgi:hypothetical protein
MSYTSVRHISNDQLDGLDHVRLSFTPLARLTFNCSVGKGPPPTLVVYALMTPITFLIIVGGIPNPVQTPPIEVAEEVT